MQTDRLLQNMHKVLSHDLPNQMVALQSLLQLLRTEEAARLTNEGREYVRRLHSATQRASEMVRFLKEMERIRSTTAMPAPMSLENLGRELQGELQQKHPQIAIAYEWQWTSPSVIADPPSFVRALVEICSGFLKGRLGQYRLSASADRAPTATRLTFFLEEGATVPIDAATPTPMRWTSHSIEQSTEMILAREWLALSRALVEVVLPGGGGVCFHITVPD